jgi:putative ubiquitin-RnfH superfamily antitoxin RatB of RatAB toxin-antitoxin module
MKNVKVVLFPGAPVNVEVEGNETVREVFEKAGLDYIGRELKIDGRAVNEDDLIGNANMLIAMKKIKGNAELKVVNFPGAPQVVSVNEGMTVREAFEQANIDFEGRELKLDGRQVDIDDLVEGGRMLIAMKKIKG